MLNELAELSRSMGHIETGLPNRNMTGYRTNGPTVWVFLDHQGSISGIEPEKDKERLREKLKYFKGENGVSFPAFNVPPLYESKSEEVGTLLRRATALASNVSAAYDNEKAQLRTQFASLCKSSRNMWSGSRSSQINKCMMVMANEIERIAESAPAEFCALSKLSRRTQLLDSDSLHTRLTATVIETLTQDPGSAKFWIDRLFFSSGKKPQDFQLILEIPDWKDYPANHEKVQSWLKRRLFEDSRALDSADAMDAFGRPAVSADQKMPTVRFQILGDVRLRAMNDESPCQFRYGRAESKSFLVGQASRDDMERSLRWLGDASRMGKTWQDVSGACGFTKRENKKVPVPAILMAYPLQLAADPPELATWFVGEDEAGGGEEAKFEKCAERVTAALKLIVREHPGTEVRVFVLAKADKARTKLVVSKCYEANRLIEAAQLWRDGCENIPTIKLNIGGEDTPDWSEPFIPFPTEVVKCLNIAWLQAGTRTDSVHGLSMGEGLALLMEQENQYESVAERALQLTISNASPLLLALGHADHRQDGSFGWNKDTARYRKHAALLPSLLGLLLYRLNYTKGGYMRTSPFLVGQMLSMADTLHKEYCRHVRKKETPPQLVGNALMTTALDNPTAGLARLSERIVPYQAWANTASDGFKTGEANIATKDGVGLAKWALQRLGQITSELGGQALPELCTDADKAQMLLGYLARPEKNDPSGGHEQIEQEDANV